MTLVGKLATCVSCYDARSKIAVGRRFSSVTNNDLVWLCLFASMLNGRYADGSGWGVADVGRSDGHFAYGL